MASRGAALEQAETGGAPARPRRRSRAKPAARRPRRPGRRAEPVGSAWHRAWRAGLGAMLVGGLTAAVGLNLAGHAPSWRSLSVICLQSVPLLPGVALFWLAVEALRARRPALPLPLWLGVVFLGTVAAMMLSSGLVFAIHSGTTALTEGHAGEPGLAQRLKGIAAAFYIYGTTAFRLWWPWSLAVPALVTMLFWRAHRR